MGDDDLTDDELLNLPGEEIPQDKLAEYFSRRAEIVQQRQLGERIAELSGNSLNHFLLRPDQDPRERHGIEEDERYRARLRTDQLLAQIEDQQRAITIRRKEIEGRALKLHDGRKVFIDGDGFRDEYGYALKGEDANEAARLKQQHPGASTWQEYAEIQRQAEEAEKLRQRALAERAGDPNPTKVAGIEQELHQQMAARAAQAPADYGSAGYGDLLADKAEKAPQPSGQGALKRS